MTLREKLLKRLEDIQTQARAIAEQEDRSEAAEANLAALLKEGEEVQARADELAKIEGLSGARSALESIQERRPSGDVNLTPGEMFVRSDVFKSYPSRGTSSRLQIETRALPSGLAAFADALPAAQKRDVTDPVAATPLLDLIPTVPVSANSVDLITWAVTAGAAEDLDEGEEKPDIEFEVSADTKTLKTLAVWTQLTRQLIEDAPAVAAKVNQMLRDDVRREAEAQAAANLVAATLPTAIGDTLLEAIRYGVAEVQSNGYIPNAVLLHPSDYAALDIDVLGSTLLGPVIGQRFWGLTPIPHAAQSEGVATVGDFRRGLERYVRTGINVYITDSHDTTFISNVFTILAEARELTVVTRANALAECSITASA